MVNSQIDIKPYLTTEMLASLIHEHLPGGEQISFEPIPTGKFNTSFFVQVDGEPLILRIAPPSDSVFVFYERNMMRQEPELHRLLSETSVPVARILAFDDSHNLIDRDYLIMERLPGWPLTEMSRIDLDITLRQVGRSLAETHGLRAKAYGYLGVHRPMNPATTWAEAFLTMWHKLIDDILAVRQYTQEESRLLRTLLDHHIPKFERPVPSSLLHMDVWHQNILVDSTGTLTGLVDWDRALWGIPRSSSRFSIIAAYRSRHSGKGMVGSETALRRPGSDRSSTFFTKSRNISSFDSAGTTIRLLLSGTKHR